MLKGLEPYGVYSFNLVKRILDETGPRESGSKSEKKAALILKEELKNYCDEVRWEDFKFAPKALLGFLRVVIVLFLIDLVILGVSFLFISLKLVLSIVSLAIMICILMVFYFHFIKYREFLDPFFPKKQSQNVYGIIQPSKEVKKTILFGGHHDSAYQFNFVLWFKDRLVLVVIVCIVPIFLLLIATVTQLILSIINANLGFLSIGNLILYLISAGSSPVTLLLWFFVSFKKVVPGAKDNLTGSAVVVAIAKYLAEHRTEIPRYTQLILLSFGAEEAGVRGSRRYVKSHLKELSQTESTFVAIDTMGRAQQLTVLEREQIAVHDKQLVDKLFNIAKTHRIPCKKGALFFGAGGGDAAPFSWAGIPATGFIGIEMHPIPQDYHSYRDTLDTIEKESLENILKLCLEFIKSEDEI